MARDANLTAIRRAYRKLAKQHHPDLNPGNAQAEARFKRIASAHGLLSDPEKRARFDSGEIDAGGHEVQRPASYHRHTNGARAAGPETWEGADVDDVLSAMFGGGRSGRGPQRGQDQHYTLMSSFLDAINGATKRLTLPDGRTLDVKIPPGTSEGDILRLRGQGGAVNGLQGVGVRGDALIEIQVAQHAFFRREGIDIKLDLPVSLPEAVLGGFIEVPTPSGKLRMRIPVGSDSQTQLRLRGRGVPAHGTLAAGDLYATLRVVIGKPDAALEAFLRDWTPEHAASPRQAMETG